MGYKLDGSQWEVSTLRSVIRHRTLTQEVAGGGVGEDMQRLKPEVGNSGEGEEERRVKNGANPAQSYSQVHYIKGYFLLKQVFFSYHQNFVHDRFSFMFRSRAGT